MRWRGTSESTLAAVADLKYHTQGIMKRGTLIIVVVGLSVLGTVAAVAATILHDGLSARGKPGKMETMVARNVRHMAIPASARGAQNPLMLSEQDLRDARLHFADHCAICHGNDGSGQTAIGGGLYPKPPDLRLPETQNLTDGEIFWIIENGVKFTGMPGFSTGEEHGSMDSWRLVHFIRHLPHLTAEERMEMERYNPKGPEDRAEEKEENDFLNGATPQKKKE
jgi:mono/diheme cytochrome c family protein